MPQLIHQGDNTSSRSGWKTLPFIITNEVMERGASVGLIPVCIKYLADEYHLSMASIAIFVLIVGAARNFTPIFGAHASKSHGRFKIIAFGSGITLQVPVIARFASNRLPNGIPPRVRMAMGIFMSCLGNVVMGFVEKRRRVAPMGTMSGNWLIPQLAMLGIGEALYMMGMLDFFNSRFPESMKSLGNALLSLGQCIGMLAAAFLLGQLRRHTRWVQEDINNGHLENYYWFVAGLSLLNFCYFLICSWAHGNHHHITWDDQPQV
ncbi:Protein NRT1/ PTR FAMILY 1.1 [Linum perenne]